jgi:hypothetical protein
MFRSRIVKLREGADRDSTLSAVLGSPTVTRLLQRLDSLCGDDSPAQYHRREISGGCFSAALQQASSDGAFRQWITRPPKGWSGGDWVRAVQLRTANLPTVGIPSNTAELRRCRGGCGANETVCHILQACPVAHDSRVRCHNAVATKIAIQCRKDGREVLEEPHVRHQDGTLYKPNLVVFRSPNDAVVCDVQISWEDGSSSTRIWHRKREVYDNAKFLEAAGRRWPGVAFEFLPLIVGARGVWPACNLPTSRALGIHPGLRRACVASVLKWGCSAHRDFMRRVWKNSATVRFRTGNRHQP